MNQLKIMQQSDDSFQDLVNDGQRNIQSSIDNQVTNSNQSYLRSSIEFFKEVTGKVVCVDYLSDHGPIFKYGTGCLIGANKVLIPANTLFSERTKKIHEHIYFFPDQYLENGYDFRSDRKIRISNYYINPQYFNEMKDRNKTHSVYDVVICELHKEDLKRLNFKSKFVNIGFRFDQAVQSQEQKQLVLCKYSEDKQLNRHVLQTKKAEYIQKIKDMKLICYKKSTQKEAKNMKHQDAFIFYKIWNNQNWDYQLIGIHKGSQGDESYGFLLNEFFEIEDSLSHQVKECKQIDFNGLMKKSYNGLLQITMNLKDTQDKQYMTIDYYLGQKQVFRLQNEQLKIKLKQLQNGVGKEINQMKNQNDRLKKRQNLLNEKVKNLQSQLNKNQLLSKEQKVKYDELLMKTIEEKQNQQKQFKETIEKLKIKIEQEKNNLTFKINQLSSQIENKIRKIDQLKMELKKKNQEMQILYQNNQELTKNIKRLQQSESQLIMAINQLINKEKQKLQNQLKNPLIPISPRRQNVSTIRKISNQRPEQKIEQQIMRPIQSDNLNSPNFINKEERSDQRRHDSMIMSGEHIILPNEPQIKNVQNLPVLSENQNNLLLNQRTSVIFNNIYLALSGRSSVLTDLDRKILQIKELYEQQIKDVYSLKNPLEYLKKVYKNNKKLVTFNYFQNSQKRIENAKKQYQVTLTQKGYNLCKNLENIDWNCEEFFQYDWINIEFLKIVGCKIQSQTWQKFCLKAQIFLPNLKVLRVELNYKIEIKQKHLNNLWSIERIWFERKQNQPKHSIWSENEVKNFMQNKMKNHLKTVKVEFRQIWVI